MKANEAPEKIYLNPLLMEDGESIVRRCTLERQRDSQVEYTRTDAFLENVQLFLIDNLKEIPMGGGKMKIKAECSIEEFILNLENYMKGE